MNITKSLRTICLALTALVGLTAQAQTFYEVHFKVGDEADDEYVGLLIYNNDEDCKLRLVSQDLLDEETALASNYIYAAEDKEDKDDVGMMMYYPVEKDFPTFIWFWSEDDASDINEAPLITFDPENLDLESCLEAEYFEEITLADMDEEYISQFYKKDEPEYKMMLAGINKVKDQNKRYGIDPNEGKDNRGGKDNGKINNGNGGKTNNGNNEKKQEPAPEPNTEPGGTVTPAVTKEASMHLIVVANTEVSDIGQACKVDKENVRSEFKGIAKVLGLKYVEHIIAESNYSKEKLAETIKAIAPNSDDIVIFVYSGHGFRFSDQKDYYPNMDLSTTSYDDPTKNYVALSDVYKELKGKGARLSLVFSDCCNTAITAQRPVISTSSLFSRSNNNFDAEKLKALFLQSEGNIIATAASPGEFSWCGVNGGFFMLSLIESMRSQISVLCTETPSWDKLVANAITSAAKKSEANAACKKQNGMKYVQVKSRQ